MGVSKNELFNERHNKLAILSKALGHPARIAIIEYLLKSDTCICSDIVAELPLAQATVSQHLKELKNAGLIKGNIEGNSICYCVNKETFIDVKAYFEEILEKVDINKITNCC